MKRLAPPEDISRCYTAKPSCPVCWFESGGLTYAVAHVIYFPAPIYEVRTVYAQLNSDASFDEVKSLNFAIGADKRQHVLLAFSAGMTVYTIPRREKYICGSPPRSITKLSSQTQPCMRSTQRQNKLCECVCVCVYSCIKACFCQYNAGCPQRPRDTDVETPLRSAMGPAGAVSYKCCLISITHQANGYTPVEV